MTGTIYDNSRKIIAILNPIPYKTSCCICENILENGKYYEIRVEDNALFTSRYLCYECTDFLKNWLRGFNID